jgi:U4/U6.U5 small nuclear ribonucleoproteins
LVVELWLLFLKRWRRRDDPAALDELPEVLAEEQGVTVAASSTAATAAPAKKDKKKKKRDDDDEETAAMRRIMGLSSFGSTKQTAVSDNNTTFARGAMAQKKGRKYRQYMNRAGGFNRPLDQMD